MISPSDSSNLKLIWSTRKYFIGLLCLVLAGAAVVMLVIVPEVRTSWKSWEELQAAQKRQQQQQEKLNKLNLLEASPDLRKRAIADSALPSRKPFFELLQSMSLVARETNVQIDKFEISPGLVSTDSAGQTISVAKNRNGAAALEVKYTVAGTFSQLNDYLKKIEAVTPFTTVVKLSIGSEITNVDATEQFRADVVSETYYFTQPLTTSMLSTLPTISDKSEAVLNALETYSAIIVPVQNEIVGGQDSIFGKTVDVLGTGAQATPTPMPSPTPPALSPAPSASPALTAPRAATRSANPAASAGQ